MHGRPPSLPSRSFMPLASLASTTVAGGGDRSSRVEHVRDAPQQSNGFDCGMYTVLLAKRLASKAAAATPVCAPPVVVEAEAAVAATVVAAASGEGKMPDQDREAVLVGGTRAEGGFGCVVGGVCDGVSGATERGSSGEEAGARGLGMSISPEFVSNERTLARERLLRCIRNQSGY